MGADGSSDVGRAPWRSATAQVFVADLATPTPEDDDAHHLWRVLRLRPGESVCAADGRGGYRMCQVAASERLVPDCDIAVGERRAPELTVGFAPVKGDRPEWVVQKLTEVGIDRILVVHTERSVVRWDATRARRHLTKLERVAREAAAQCRRLWLPEIGVGAVGVGANGATGLGGGQPAVLADAGGRTLTGDDHCVLIGPEGGWTDAERSGCERVALGDHVMRSETAAVVAGSAMASLRLGLSRPGLT